MTSLKDALDMLNVSMEQGNSLYRNIVKKMFEDQPVRAQPTTPPAWPEAWRVHNLDRRHRRDVTQLRGGHGGMEFGGVG